MLDLPEDAEADFAVAVEVGVEAHCVVARSDELHPGRVDGVVRGAAEQEEEEASFIGRVERPGYECMDLREGEEQGGTEAFQHTIGMTLDSV